MRTTRFKSLWLAAVLLVIPVLAAAQISLPDSGGYVVFREDIALNYDWLEISTGSGGSGTKVSWDVIQGNFSYAEGIPLGFPFNYYGSDYDTINIMSCGWGVVLCKHL